MQYVKLRAHNQKREKIDKLANEIVMARDIESMDIYLWEPTTRKAKV